MPWAVAPSDRCEYVEAHAFVCGDTEGIPYLRLRYCALNRWPVVATALALVWTVVLFVVLMVGAERFFCPALEVISDFLRLPANVAGATLLSFGNGAPDLFTQLAAISAMDDSAVPMALGEPVGGGLFVSNVVLAAVVLVGMAGKPVAVERRAFMRDAVFYFGGLLLLVGVCFDGQIVLPEGALLLAYYAAFVLYTVLVDSAAQEPLQLERSRHYQHVLSHALPDDLSSPLSRITITPLTPRPRSSRQSPSFGGAADGALGLFGRPLVVNVSAPANILRLSGGALAPFSAPVDSPSATAPGSSGSLSAAALDGSTLCLAESSSAPTLLQLLQPRPPAPVAADERHSCSPRSDAANSLAGSLASGTERAAQPAPGAVDGGFDDGAERACTINVWPRDSEPDAEPDGRGGAPLGRRGRCLQAIPSFFRPVADDGDRGRCADDVREPLLDGDASDPRHAGTGRIAPGAAGSATASEPPWTAGDWLKLPFVFVLRLTMPEVGMDDTVCYPKPFAVLLPITAPLFVVYAKDLPLDGAALLYGFACSLFSAVVIYSIYPASGRHYGVLSGFFTLVSFGMSVLWMDVAAGELVRVCKALGYVYGLSQSLLGVTVLAWGNSVGDLVANVTMARDGFPSMATAACFGSPLFTLTGGLGVMVTGTVLARGPLAFRATFPLRVALTFALASTARYIATVPLLHGWSFTRGAALGAVAFYVAFQAVYVLLLASGEPGGAAV